MLTRSQPRDAHMLEEIYMSFRKLLHRFSERMKIIRSSPRGISQRRTETLHSRFPLAPLAWKIIISYSQRREIEAGPDFRGAVQGVICKDIPTELPKWLPSLPDIVPPALTILLYTLERNSEAGLSQGLLDCTVSNAVPTKFFRS